MVSEIITLDVPYEKCGVRSDGCKALLTSFIPELVAPEMNDGKRPAVIVCPGGGYDYCSDREAEPAALRFSAFGIPSFVLNYSCYQKRFPINLLELACAVKYVRANANSLHIDPDKIIVCGFSAGGHLAASLAVHWNKPYICDVLSNNGEINHMPNGAILCYPVITSGIYTHKGSIKNIAGDDINLINTVSLENHVSSDTPPVFIWHTANDDVVPVQNSIDFISALAKYKVPFESHIYPSGPHGLALCDVTTARYDGHLSSSCGKWFKLAVNWIYNSL